MGVPFYRVEFDLPCRVNFMKLGRIDWQLCEEVASTELRTITVEISTPTMKRSGELLSTIFIKKGLEGLEMEW